MFSNIPQGYQFVKDHSKTSKMDFWMIQRAKNEVFGQILRLSVLDWLYTAYYDSTKRFSTVENIKKSLRIIEGSQKCTYEWTKEQKMMFFVIFFDHVCWIDVILHILTVINGFLYFATCLGHEASVKYHRVCQMDRSK